MLTSIIILLFISPLVFLAVLFKTHFSSEELSAMGIALEKQIPKEAELVQN